MAGVITGQLVGVLAEDMRFVNGGGRYWTATFLIQTKGRATGVRVYRDGAYIGAAALSLSGTDPMRRGDTLTVTLWDADPAMSEELRRALALAA